MKTNFGGRRRAAKRVRLGLLFLATLALVPGLWASISPASFFSDFGDLSFSWVPIAPPFNEHLVRDVGAAYLAFSVPLLAAAFIMDRRLSQIALLAWLVFAATHLFFHIDRQEWTPGADKTQAIALGLTVVLPAILIPLARRAERG